MGASRTAPRRVWLLKTEPESFSFDDLLSAPKKRARWDGVRNYQARNFLRDDVAIGDLALVYHSSADPTGVVGLARVVKAAEPDPTQFDPDDDHFDGKSQREEPRWVQIEIEALARLPQIVTLAMLKADPRLARMLVVQRGQRLSVQPVQAGEARAVLELAGLDPAKFLS
ncbi:MAG: EVE domain-containing protein [Planctomycetota bacterium]|nr:EVE domain-containing protein [Planctomycetota bacterium]